MSKQIIGVLGALAVATGFAGPASASTFVDITYDLSDTTFPNATAPECPDEACVTIDLISGSMTIRYTSNSASSMPILSGPATLQSLNLSGNALHGTDAFTPGTTYVFTTANLQIDLVSPVAGNLLSGGTLTLGSARIRVGGSRHCSGAPNLYTGLCVAFGGTFTSVTGPLGPYTSTTAALSFAASPGPSGGALSTRQTVSGTIPARAPTKLVAGNGVYWATQASLVGREILRQAPGHDPKVIPEPGTLLLLGVSTGGLVLVSRVTRRSRQG